MVSKPLDVFKAPLTGVSLVEASAGTGKTYNITSLYIRAILEKDLEPSEILVMTFTEAATAELKSRLRTRLKDALHAFEDEAPNEDAFLKELMQQPYHNAAAKIRTAIEQFDEAAVFTIHGFCNRILSEYSLLFDVPPQFELLTDASELLQDCVDNYWRDFMYAADENELDWFTLDFLSDQGFEPDDLRKIFEEVLTHPRSSIVPDELTRGDLAPNLQQLMESFDRLKAIWEREGQQIADMYLNGKLHGNRFRQGSNTWKEDWQGLLELLSSDRPKIGISDRMNRFGAYMKTEGSTSSFQVPDLDFFKEMDAYVALTEQLQFLKPAFIREAIKDIKKRFDHQKRVSNVLSYNDLLELTEAGLTGDETGTVAHKLSEKFPLALVDEFQDTDPIQYNIFRQIYHGREDKGLFMIGDPKQAIYGFRGADIFTYISARSDVSQGQSYHLLHNYRSNQAMINGVNDLFEQSQDSFLLHDLSFQPAAFPEGKKETYLTNSLGDTVNPLQFISLNDEFYSNKSNLEQDIYQIIANEIDQLLSGDYLLNGEKVQEKDIAILVWKGKEGEAFQAALRERGINAVLRSRSSVFKTQEAEELLRVLSAIQKISFEYGVRSALATSLLGYTAEELHQLGDDEERWSDLITLFNDLKERWNTGGIDAALNGLFDAFDIIPRISKAKRAERRISNLYHLSELLSKYAREQKLDAKALLKWFNRKVNEDRQNASSEDEELRLESDEDLIQISTMHSSKGLEYPIVFCPFLWNSTSSTTKNSILKFYHEDAIHIDISQQAEHPHKEQFRRLTEHQNRAEDVRLTYVALTRAVSACFVVLPNYKKLNESPLAYILNGGNGIGKYSDHTSIADAMKKAEAVHVRDPLPLSPDQNRTTQQDLSELKTAIFQRSDVFHFPRMLSYSSLAGKNEHADTGKDYDELVINETEGKVESYDRFGFPRGANAGTCLHMIFEDIVFSDPDLHKVITHNLEYYGIDESWVPMVKEWIDEVLSHSLKEPDISLSDIAEDKLLKEMEFYFPVNDLEPSSLWRLIRAENSTPNEGEETLEGFMKGYIDLIFEHENTFYILDYKSNHLGNNFEDYGSEELEQAMLDAGYDLQYHIYTLALHRFLSAKMENYSYEENFGGVLYLYLKGVNKKTPASGVFFHKPEFEVIQTLDEFFKGEH